MKIGNSPELNTYTKVGQERTGAADAGRTSTAGKAAQPQAGAQVEISAAAASLMGGVESEPQRFDAEKVQRIAQAIAEGKFTINAEAIAEKMIGNAEDLVSASRSH